MRDEAIGVPEPLWRWPGEWAALAAIALCAGLTPLLGGWLLVLALALPAAAAIAWWTLARPARWFAAFCFATLLLPPLPFAWGDTGPHPSIVFAALGLAAGLARAGEWSFPQGPALAICALPAALALSLPLALALSGPAVFAGSFARWGLFCIGVYAFLYFTHGPGRGVFASGAEESDSWLRALYALAAAAGVWALADFYFQFPPLTEHAEQYVWLSEGAFLRAQGWFYDAGMLGNFCTFFLVMTLAAWLDPEPRPAGLPRWALIGGAAVLATALLASFSRSSLLSLAAASAALLFLYRRSLRPWRIAASVAAGAGLAAALALAVFPRFVETFTARLWATFAFFFETPGQVLAGRLESWRTLAEFLAWNPQHWLLGIGYKTLPYTEFLGKPLIADNMYLALLVETGIIGVAAFALFLGGVLWIGWRAACSPRPRARLLGAWSLAFWTGQLFQMMSVDALTYWRVLPIYLGVLGLAWRASQEPQ